MTTRRQSRKTIFTIPLHDPVKHITKTTPHSSNFSLGEKSTMTSFPNSSTQAACSRPVWRILLHIAAELRPPLGCYCCSIHIANHHCVVGPLNLVLTSLWARRRLWLLSTLHGHGIAILIPTVSILLMRNAQHPGILHSQTLKLAEFTCAHTDSVSRQPLDTE